MRQRVKAYWRALRARPLVIVFIVAGIAVLGWWFLFSNGDGTPSFETALVERGFVLRTVSETGVVAPADEVSLAFTSAGRIVSVQVGKGDRVAEGQTLARLEAAQAQASLAQAQAALRAAEARATSSGGTYAQTAEQHNQLVASAYRRLLSTGLTTVPDSSAYTVAPPVISGLYDGLEGTYKLRIERGVNANEYKLVTFELERTGPIEILKDEPTALGTRGLFVSFPNPLAGYYDTTWYVTIPNTKSSSYLASYNAYQEALQARESALLSAQNAPVLQADIDQARAAVAAAEATLAQTALTAPFAGIITALAATPGQIASPGTPILSLISMSRFEITVEIPEDDIVGVEVGDRARVSFDALDDATLEAEVVYVAPAATNADGVSFEVVLQFVEDDERILVGLTTDVDIFADSRENVLVVPVRAVIEEDGSRYVRVMEGETAYRRVPVAVGLRGGGLYEITGGLEGGERIITFANTVALSALTEID